MLTIASECWRRHGEEQRRHQGTAVDASVEAAASERPRVSGSRRHLGDSDGPVDPESPGLAGSPSPAAGSLTGAEVELDASLSGEGPKTPEAAANVVVEDETVRGTEGAMRDFPAMVLPGMAAVGAEQEFGSLPSQWVNRNSHYRQGCVFVLTLQVGM